MIGNGETTADVIVFADIAAMDEPILAGSYGKGAFAIPSGKRRSLPWSEDELKEAKREKALFSTFRIAEHAGSSVRVRRKRAESVVFWRQHSSD